MDFINLLYCIYAIILLCYYVIVIMLYFLYLTCCIYGSRGPLGRLVMLTVSPSLNKDDYYYYYYYYDTYTMSLSTCIYSHHVMGDICHGMGYINRSHIYLYNVIGNV
jgi:hypothetical protein